MKGIVAFFIPVFGPLMLLVDKYCERRGRMGTRDIGIESQRYTEMKYKRIEVDNQKNQDITVPLEEAMIVNDKTVRRSMMLDILKQNTDDCVPLLKRARMSNDTELTHYATTAMMEIQSQYELRLHKWAKDYEENSRDVTILKGYSKELMKYIESGLISGNILKIYRQQLEEVTEKLVAAQPEELKYRLQQCYNLLELEHYEKLEPGLNTMKKKWPEDEKVYRLCGEYYRRTSQGDKFRKMLEKIEKRNIYLSSDGKKWLAFWKNVEEDNEEVSG